MQRVLHLVAACCAMMMPMQLPEDASDLFEQLGDKLQRLPAAIEEALPDSKKAHTLLVTAAWVVGGLGVLTLGLIAGRELRGRYKFNRRTPYDYYAHSGDRSAGLDYSVGI